MGTCLNCLTGEPPSSREIGSHMSDEKERDAKTQNILLLGTGNAGKTTFYTQFRLMTGNDPTTIERHKKRTEIEHQVVNNMIILAQECLARQDSGEMTTPLSEKGTSMAVKLIEVQREDDVHYALSQDAYQFIKHLWHIEPGVREVFDSWPHGKPTIPESCTHFWDAIDRVAEISYVPTDQDLVNLRAPTTGMTSFVYGDKSRSCFCKVIDIGGQKSERRKWHQMFDNINIIVWVASMTAYDEVMFDYNKINSMEDQLDEFDKRINSDTFLHTPVILFLNKSDLFRIKLANGRFIGNFFQDYDGDNSFIDSRDYILQQFFDRNKNPNRTIYSHITTATDPENARRVLSDVTEYVIRHALQKAGLIGPTLIKNRTDQP